MQGWFLGRGVGFRVPPLALTWCRSASYRKFAQFGSVCMKRNSKSSRRHRRRRWAQIWGGISDKGGDKPPPWLPPNFGVLHLVPQLLREVPALVQGHPTPQLHGQDAGRRQLLHHPRHSEKRVVPQEFPKTGGSHGGPRKPMHPKTPLHPQKALDLPKDPGTFGFPLVIAFALQLSLQNLQ